MINTLLEHVPIKMEVKDVDESTNRLANNVNGTEMAKDDDNIDETDDDVDDDEDEDDEEDDDEEDEDEEESDTESEALEIEQEATMLISSDEEAELEAQRIRFPDIIIPKKLRKDSSKTSRSSSRNSQTSNPSSKPHINIEVISKKNTIKEADKKQSISPRLKHLENSISFESSIKENNNNNNTQILLKTKSDNKKLESNTSENNKNKQTETNKRLENQSNSKNNRNVENLLKSPINFANQRSRRGSNNSTCSIASSVASDSAETESCGNIYVFNLQQKLIFNCEFCDLKYNDLENFSRHLNETHELFNNDEDPEKENAPRNLRKTNCMINNASKNAANVKKEPLQCLELLTEPPVALPPSVLAEPLDSCGNVFMLNHRKLYLVCGYCECKYANLDLFEKHLRQQHRIFEVCRNELNVVPKEEVKEEEVFIITEVVDKPNVRVSPAMIATPLEISLNKSNAPLNECETTAALDKTIETSVKVNRELPTSSATSLVGITAEPAAVKEQDKPVNAAISASAKDNVQATEGVYSEPSSSKRIRSKRHSSSAQLLATENKRPKRSTRNNTRSQNEPTTTSVEGKLPDKTSETGQVVETQENSETPKAKETKDVRELNKSAESIKDTLPVTTENKETKKINVKLTDTEITKTFNSNETRKTRTSTKAAQVTKSTSQVSKETGKTKKTVKPKKQMSAERTLVKEARRSTKSPPTKQVKQDKPEIQKESNVAKLKCSLCPKEFARKDTLKIHERTHTGEKPYACDICPKKFGARTNLYIHKKFHMGDSHRKYKCEVCDKKFFRNTDRKVHMSSHSNEKGFKCGICMRGYSSKLNVKRHMDRDHAKEVKNKRKSSRKENVASTKVEEDPTLRELPSTAPQLIEPMQETSLPREGNAWDDLNTDPVNDIIEQLQSEMVETQRENSEVNAITFTINTLSGSEVSEKPSEIVPMVMGAPLNEIDNTDDVKPTLLKIVKRFFCDMCPRTFEKHMRLVEHKRLHTGEKPFSCDECGKKFRIRMRLNEHKLRHSKEKKFKCEICQLGCCTKQDLNLHMRHHTNDRRYQCTMCPKAFVRSSDLKIHVRVHTGEKPYMCDICHKCFRANQNLSVHKKSHMGEASKTYKCERCDKKFMRNIDRKIHMRSHTGEKPYKCEICQRGYSSKVNVRAHIERDHISANGVGTPPKGKKKPGPKPRALKEELEKQKKLIEELQNQLLQQIKTDEKIILPDEMMEQHSSQESTMPDTSPLSVSSKVDPIQSAYELLNKLKSSSNTSKPLTLIPSPPPMAEPPSNPFTKAKKDSTNLLPLTITQKLEQHSPVPSSSSSQTTISRLTPSPSNTTATKVVSQKTSLGIQQVSVTVSMQVENVTPNPTNTEKENAGILTNNSNGTTSVKKERKITSYFTVVGQKTEV